jgi:hypothetical protein
MDMWVHQVLYAVQLSFAPGDVGEIKDGEN